MSDYILVHHGIKGQKWGVRRYQNEDGSYTTAGRERYGIGKRSTSVDDIVSRMSGRKLSSVGNFKDFVNNNFDLSKENLKNVGIEAATTLAPLAIGAGVLLVNRKMADKRFNNLYEKRDIATLSEIPRLSKTMTAEESVKVVNPNYPKKGYVDNCMLCTTAMVMREKGYDVKAAASNKGFFQKNLDKCFTGEGTSFKKIKARNLRSVVDELSSNGDGAYGNFTVEWNCGGGHSMFWKNENGKTVIYDAQSGDTYDLSKKTKFSSYINPRKCQYARLDQAEPTEMVLAAITR